MTLSTDLVRPVHAHAYHAHCALDYTATSHSTCMHQSSSRKTTTRRAPESLSGTARRWAARLSCPWTGSTGFCRCAGSIGKAASSMAAHRRLGSSPRSMQKCRWSSQEPCNSRPWSRGVTAGQRLCASPRATRNVASCQPGGTRSSAWTMLGCVSTPTPSCVQSLCCAALLLPTTTLVPSFRALSSPCITACV